MKLLFFFTLFIALAFQQSNHCKNCAASFELSLKTAGKYTPWRPRVLTSTRLSGLLGVGQVFKSSAKTKVDGETDIDGLRIAAYALNGATAPTISMAYFKRAVDVSTGANGYDYDVSAAYSYIAHKLFSIEEFDPASGQVYNRVFLRPLTWSLVDGLDGNSDSPFLAMSSTASGLMYGSLSIELDFIATSQAATITSNANGAKTSTLLAPKGLELVIVLNLKNYIYSNSSNCIRLVTYTASGASKNTINATSTNPLSSGDTYSYISSSGSVGDNNQGLMGLRFANWGQLASSGRVNVWVNFTTSNDISLGFSGDAASLQITNKFGTSAVITQGDIVIQAPGFKDIFIYDPTATSGPDPTTSSSMSSDSSLLAGSFLALFLICFSFF